MRWKLIDADTPKETRLLLACSVWDFQQVGDGPLLAGTKIVEGLWKDGHWRPWMGFEHFESHEYLAPMCWMELPEEVPYQESLVFSKDFTRNRMREERMGLNIPGYHWFNPNNIFNKAKQ